MDVAIENLSDEELIFRARLGSGHGTADLYLNEVFRRYQAKVISWCYRFAKDREGAADLAQDVLLKAWSHLDSFRHESKVATWLYAIARNHCICFMRKKGSEPVVFAGEYPETAGDKRALSAFHSIETDQLIALMRRAISTKLTPLEIAVLQMHYVEGLPLNTITNGLKLSNPTGAKAYLVKARRKLTWALRKRSSRAKSCRTATRPRAEVPLKQAC